MSHLFENMENIGRDRKNMGTVFKARVFSIMLCLALCAGLIGIEDPTCVLASGNVVYEPLKITSGFNIGLVAPAGVTSSDLGNRNLYGGFTSTDKWSQNGGLASYSFVKEKRSGEDNEAFCRRAGLPDDGKIIDKTNSDLYWQLESYESGVKNALRLDSSTAKTGSFTFSKVGCYQKVWFLTVGYIAGAANLNVSGFCDRTVPMRAIITYTDGTQSDYTYFDIPHLYCRGDKEAAAYQFVRVKTDGQKKDTDDPQYLTKCAMNVDTSKLIASIQVEHVGDTGLVSILGITGETYDLPAPTGLAASNIHQTDMTVSWNEVTGAASYRIDVATDNNFTTMVSGYNNLQVSANSCQITGLTEDMQYYVRVRAEVAAGQSASSAVISLKTAKSDSIAYIIDGGSTIYYSDLQTAFNAGAGSSDTDAKTVYLVDDYHFTVDKTNITIDSNKVNVFDLNGHTLFFETDQSTTSKYLFNQAAGSKFTVKNGLIRGSIPIGEDGVGEDPFKITGNGCTLNIQCSVVGVAHVASNTDKSFVSTINVGDGTANPIYFAASNSSYSLNCGGNSPVYVTSPIKFLWCYPGDGGNGDNKVWWIKTAQFTASSAGTAFKLEPQLSTYAEGVSLKYVEGAKTGFDADGDGTIEADEYFDTPFEVVVLTDNITEGIYRLDEDTLNQYTAAGYSAKSVSTPANAISGGNWYEVTKDTYTITYNTNSGTIAASPAKAETYSIDDAGRTIDLPTSDPNDGKPTISYAGHKFEGWYTSESFSGSPVTGIVLPSSDSISKSDLGNRVYYAKWADITVTKATTGTPAAPVPDPVYGVAEDGRQLFIFTPNNFSSAPTLQVEWKSEQGTWSTTPSAVGLSLSNDGKVTTSAATPIGNYVFRVTNGEAESSYNFASSGEITLTVNLAPQTITPPIANSITYDGLSHELVAAGTAANGTLQYAVGLDAVTPPGYGWSVTIPTGASAGTYYVWYKSIGNTGYLDTDPACISVTVNKAAPASTPDSLLVTGVKPSDFFQSDGKITGTDTTMEYSTNTDFAPAYDCGSGETTGLSAGIYYVRYSETDNYTASGYISVTIDAGDLLNINGVVITNYDDVYDGYEHGISVSGDPIAVSGAAVSYGLVPGMYDSAEKLFTDATTNTTDGKMTIHVKVSLTGYNDFYGSGTVTIRQRDITGATHGAFTAMTYSGSAQTPEAAVTVGGFTVTGSWSSVTNVADVTAFTANGNFTGTLTNCVTGMSKYTPVASPAGITATRPSGYGRSDGKIVGTTADMEYSTTEDFASPLVCSAGETAGLPAGTYYVRIRNTDNTNVGPFTIVTIENGNSNDPPVPTPEPEPEPDPDKDPDKDPNRKGSGETEKFTIPVTGDDTVQVEAEITDGNAEVKDIRPKDIKNLYTESKGGKTGENSTVTIDLSTAEQEVTSVTLTKQSVKNLAKAANDEESPVETVEIRLSNATIVLDSKALETINEEMKGQEIRVVVQKKEDLNEVQQEALSDVTVEGTFDVHMESNGVEVHEFNGGNVEVSISFVPEPGKDPKHYFIYYVADDGTTEKYDTRYEGGRIIFITTHLSDYVIVYDEGSTNSTRAAKAPVLKLKKTIGVGKKFKLKLTNASEDAKIKFVSSDESIATVSRKGVIRATGVGECRIKCVIKQNGTSYKFKIMVRVLENCRGNRQTRNSECLTPDSVMPLLNIYKLVKAEKPVKLELGKLTKNAKVSYEVEDESIARVSDDGVITGLADGMTGISVYVTQRGTTYQYRLFVRVRTK